MLDFSEKFCPVCKNKIDRDATVCSHCGASLDGNRTDLIPTTGSSEGGLKPSPKVPESLIDDTLIPEDGIAIYAAGTSKPFYLHVNEELIIGRKIEETSEAFLDFSDMDGFNLGLSRKHAKIRRNGTRYEVIDLSSTNGTRDRVDSLVNCESYFATWYRNTVFS